ncbi:MAG: protein translocase subunit SecDF [Flavobacteriaceae bacterium CG_4_8_14_3_um_filter_34_10]|nr:protein translocase subunit SecDF [Flavobacteriia bacterium]OIP50284.1 MAG: protein translocase subunit SecDF [Flavobacteriaceae bacterium CG2_30_34_30]PIQ19632.1 MAG: protein translocase subunit SecDF [Flavobacteriaceae bacterium CG18_big_fil_WC_8_21_14_2_50_34_36]PIV49039.1 MAG: protein translocase subunit SecDF [Flavobacteriaceae bacterium CG02_land_8_20_14_3_00_34_13]PIX10556.1 MAG: protein translocase subunit SecDF [Flavobacteriaceae bacterium CG_4_8_14_3_um_filter_34_10]PIZ08507.1 MAG
MQNKGLIIVFAVLFGLVSIYQLSFTYISTKVEGEAKEYAISKVSENTEDYTVKRDLVEKTYLDSVANNPVLLGVNYTDAKDKELNKGLDLKGGINVILQISVKDILKGLSNNSKDPAFNQALDKATEIQKEGTDTFIDAFYKAYTEIPGDNKLASPDVFANKLLSEEVNFDMTNAEVKRILDRKVDESVDAAFEVLRKRIDKFGVTQPNLQRLGNSERILVELPGARDIERVKGLLQSTAQLEFWHTYKVDELASFLPSANQLLKNILKPETEEKAKDSTETTEIDDVSKLLGGEDVKSQEEGIATEPIFSKVLYQGSQGGPILAAFKLKDTAQINAYLKMPQVRNLLSQEQRFAKFVWGKPTILKETGEQIAELYALKANRDNIPPLGGSVVVDASQGFDQRGQPAVNMQMDGKGSRIWEEMTGLASTQQSQIAIVLDNIVYSAPGVSRGAISGGRSEITGSFTLNEAIDLANVLRAGKLPASADIIQSEIVGPSLGQEAIDSGIMSFLLALGLVLLWMIGYYGKAGIFADIALTVNILFIFGVLAGLGAVLTLPGIAGIVLTIGMSVDANVLIFERIREELYKGKSQKDAIKDGFNNALSSILDANITTALTGIILLVFGTGPIKGFATTLLIGILTSLFTAIFITRLFIDRYTLNGKPLSFSTTITQNLFKNLSIDFLGKRKIAYIISGTLIVLSIFSLFTQGLNQGVDFVGGRTYTVRFDKTVIASEIQSDLVAVYGSAEAKTFGGNNQLKITTKYKVDEQGSAVDEEVQTLLFKALQPNLPAGFTYEDFLSGDETKQVGLMQSMKVGPTIASDIKSASVWAVSGSLIVVFLYILLRFRRWQFSLGAVVAVIHDVLIVLGIFSLLRNVMPFSMELDQAFIAAILTVIGYSLNDTVVVFDRIREYFNDNPSWKMGRIINSAVNSTISRTLNTSFTTLVVLLAIFIFGGDSIRGFMFALIIGIVVGTYSSIFIATPVMFDTVKKKGIDLKNKEIETKEEALNA